MKIWKRLSTAVGLGKLAIVLILLFVPLWNEASAESTAAAKAKEDFFAEAAEHGLSRDDAMMVWAIFHVGTMEDTCANRGFIDIGYREELARLLLGMGGRCVCSPGSKIPQSFLAANQSLKTEVAEFEAQDDDFRERVCARYRGDLADLKRGVRPQGWPYGADR